MRMKKRLTYLLMLLLLPLLGGCSEEDDVLEIFTGKTWKLTYIALEGQHQMFDFWNDDAAARRSMELLEQGATFVIEFNGSETSDYVNGDFEARAVNRSQTGLWAADGASRELHLTDIKSTGNAETDILARAFLTGLENAIRYSGDSQYLYIYYEDGQTTKCMAFHIQ